MTLVIVIVRNKEEPILLGKASLIKPIQRDVKRNFKWPSNQIGQCPIYNGTLSIFVRSSSKESYLFKYL